MTLIALPRDPGRPRFTIVLPEGYHRWHPIRRLVTWRNALNNPHFTYTADEIIIELLLHGRLVTPTPWGPAKRNPPTIH